MASPLVHGLLAVRTARVAGRQCSTGGGRSRRPAPRHAREVRPVHPAKGCGVPRIGRRRGRCRPSRRRHRIPPDPHGSPAAAAAGRTAGALVRHAWRKWRRESGGRSGAGGAAHATRSGAEPAGATPHLPGCANGLQARSSTGHIAPRERKRPGFGITGAHASCASPTWTAAHVGAVRAKGARRGLVEESFVNDLFSETEKPSSDRCAGAGVPCVLCSHVVYGGGPPVLEAYCRHPPRDVRKPSADRVPGAGMKAGRWRMVHR